MNLSEIGFDISNLQTCTIKKKGILGSLILLIIAGSFLPILIVFVILFLTQSTIEINNVLTSYGDPGYLEFFYGFLGSFGSITLLLLFSGLFLLLKKPKLHMIVDQDPLHMETFYYIYHRKQEIYLTDRFAVIYNHRYQTIQIEQDKARLDELLHTHVFWISLLDAEDPIIKQTLKKTKVTIKLPYKHYQRAYVIKRYVFPNDFQYIPTSFTETLGYGSPGSRSYQSSKKYYLENINRAQHVDIHPEIKKALQNLV